MAWGWFGITPGEGTEFEAPAEPWAPDFSVAPDFIWTAETPAPPSGPPAGTLALMGVGC